MRRTDGRSATPTRAGMTLWAGLSVFAALACAQDVPRRFRPIVVSLNSAKTAADSVNDVLARAREDTGFDTNPGVGDEQRLMLGRCPRDCRYGPQAKIQPHLATAYVTDASPDSQVVIARIINLDPIAYTKFNLHGRDTVYWAIGRRGGRTVSFFYSSVPGVAPFVSDLDVERHAVPPYRQALARWVWDDRDESAWGTCDGGRCCRSSGVALP